MPARGDPKNVFVLGLDDFHLVQLQALRQADRYRFHELYRKEDVKAGHRDVAERILTGARERLATFDGTVDAIVGYWDFPVSTMLPLLRRELGLPTPSFESVLRCEHKYWSRLEQAQVVPDHIPTFCAVDPFAEDVLDRITIGYPFWIKPVKSVLSYLGFRIESEWDLEQAIPRIRDGIDRIAVPFDHLLGFADLPAAVAHVGGRWCIAESIISRGHQCTLEGYALEDEIVVYGAVDSIREGVHGSSFSRYQYPSALPPRVLDRMAELTRRFLSHVGYRHSPFNIEFYWNEQTDRISLLEVNTRISKSHAPLFKLVDGEFHHQVMLDVALGERPDFPFRKGEYPIAAKFMWRAFEDAVVRRVPGEKELHRLCERFPGLEIELQVEAGDRLSQLGYQDSYSYELAAIFLGGESEDELLSRYEECRRLASIELNAA
jgi:biotin carboxylase